MATTSDNNVVLDEHLNESLSSGVKNKETREKIRKLLIQDAAQKSQGKVKKDFKR